jgi:hypothetical protein
MALSLQQKKIVITSLKAFIGSRKGYKKDFEITENLITLNVDKTLKDRQKRIQELYSIQEYFTNLSKQPGYNYLKASYTPQAKGKTGGVKISGLQIKVKGEIEMSNDPEDLQPLIDKLKNKLKPADVSPSIVGSWFTPKEIVQNLTTYLKKEITNESLLNGILDLINDAANSTSYEYNYNIPKLSAEFFEILLALKFSKLLDDNDEKIKKILGKNVNENLTKNNSVIKIFFPRSVSYPLIDFFVTVTPGQNKKNFLEEPSFKISAKAKISSPTVKTNTVKFTDVFTNNTELKNWYKTLSKTIGSQVAQRIIAQAALDASKSQNRVIDIQAILNGTVKRFTGEPAFTIPALKRLFDKNTSSIKNTANTYKGMEQYYTSFKNVLDIVAPLVTSKSVKKTDLLSDSTKIKIESDDLSNVLKLFKENFDTKKTITPTVANLAYLCERILVSASKENSPSKINFWQMFYDRVLLNSERPVVYGIPVLEINNKLVYKFYAAANWKDEYHSWLSLRSKNSPNEVGEALGISTDKGG